MVNKMKTVSLKLDFVLFTSCIDSFVSCVCVWWYFGVLCCVLLSFWFYFAIVVLFYNNLDLRFLFSVILESVTTGMQIK